MGFDYGKFDYVVQNGEVVLFDANRTPGGSFLKHAHCQPLEMLARYLAGGIWSLLDRQAGKDSAMGRDRIEGEREPASSIDPCRVPHA
jgi:hypothetical protein